MYRKVSHRNYKILLLPFLIVTTFVLFYLVTGFSSNKVDKEKEVTISKNEFQFENFHNDRARWDKMVDELGAHEAYKRFKEEYKRESYGLQHSAAHIFGELLFDKLGNEGISVCDSSYAFGCYHSFFGKAIAVDGLEVIEELSSSCDREFGNRSLPCRHGIGHGILTYVGSNNLLKALDLCANISERITGGCSSGVFMEYNFRTMESLSSSEIVAREFEENSVHDPCDTVSEKYKPSCYFEQTQWWISVFHNDYQKIGNLCAEVSGVLSRVTCFQGAGNYAASHSEFGVELTVQRCKLMPSEESQALCLQGASWLLLTTEYGLEKAMQVCASLDREFEAKCIDQIVTNPFYES